MKQYKEDEIILNENENNDILYKVVSGKVALYQHYREDNEYLIGVLSEQRYFGEVSFLNKTESPYTAVAVSDVLIMEINRSEFENFIVRNAGNAIDIMEHLAQTVNTLNHHMDLISQELTHNLEKGKGIPIDLKKKLLEYKVWR